MHKYKLYKLLNKVGILSLINTTTSILVNKKTIKLPVIQSHGYQNLITIEEWANTLYEKILNVLPGAFIDVGFNNGQTLIKVKTLDAERKYIGFEANAICYSYTRQLISKNNFSNCILFPVGLSNKNEMLTLHYDKEFASGASVLPEFRNNKSRYNITQQVAVMTGDEILQQQNLFEIAIIKADVEGAELEVIQGLQQTINQFKPVILLEILPAYNLETTNGKFRFERQVKLVTLLHELDYTMYNIDEDNVTLMQVDKAEVTRDLTKTNFLFIPKLYKEKVTALFKLK